MHDPFGTVLALIRDDAAVVAAVGDVSAKVKSRAVEPRSVQLVDSVTTRRPTGIGSARLGLQLWQGFARCYGPNEVGGDISARELAGLVSDALHGRHAIPGTGGTFVLRIYAADIDGVFRDPETRWPYYDVRIECFAGA